MCAADGGNEHAGACAVLLHARVPSAQGGRTTLLLCKYTKIRDRGGVRRELRYSRGSRGHERVSCRLWYYTHSRALYALRSSRYLVVYAAQRHFVHPTSLRGYVFLLLLFRSLAGRRRLSAAIIVLRSSILHIFFFFFLMNSVMNSCSCTTILYYSAYTRRLDCCRMLCNPEPSERTRQPNDY